MACYDKKIILSGDIIEYYHYDRYFVRRPENTQEIKKSEEFKTNNVYVYSVVVGKSGAVLNGKYYSKGVYTFLNERPLCRGDFIIKKDIVEKFKEKKYDQNKNEKLSKNYITESMKKSAQRSKKRFRRLINTNRRYFDKFLTLTFSDGVVTTQQECKINGKVYRPGKYYMNLNNKKVDIKDPDKIQYKEFDINIKKLKECNYEFKKFRQRLVYEIKKIKPNFTLKYIIVPEFQDENDRGAVHYHLLLNIPFMSVDKIRDIWGLGHVSINKIKNLDDIDDMGSYMGKYLEKGFQDPRYFEEKKFFCSRSLDRPKEMITDQAIYRIMSRISGFDTVYESTFKIEDGINTEVIYKIYNLRKMYKDYIEFRKKADCSKIYQWRGRTYITFREFKKEIISRLPYNYLK